MIIRPVKAEDAPELHRLRTMAGVRENILAMPDERLADTEAFLRGLSPNDHVLVAETGGFVADGTVVDGAVVGCAGLHVSPRPRERHTGKLGIMVHADYQRRGIGTALLAALLDIADNWLLLKRVELCVFVDNEPAAGLYRKMGFVVEGTKKYSALRKGEHADEYLMARYGK